MLRNSVLARGTVRFMLSAAIAGAMVGTAVPAMAAAPTRPPALRAAAGLSARTVTSAAFAQAVRQLEPYVVHQANGTTVIEAPQSIVHSMDPRAYRAVLESAAAVDRAVTAGMLVAGPHGRLDLAVSVRGPRYAAASTPLAAAASQPGSSIAVHWWGIVIHLDPANAKLLLRVLGGVGSISSVASVLVSAGVITSAAAVPFIVVSGIAVLAATALTACTTSEGLDLDITWLVISWCNKPGS